MYFKVKQLLLVVISFFIIITMHAQTGSVSATGEYYLQGVMETASGFKLNSDHSFEFFFSYGALDRSGKGQWKQEKNTIIFTSPQNKTADYTLVRSKKQNDAGITISITGGNGYLQKMVHAIIKSGDKEEQAGANEKGIITAKATSAGSIVLLFEWCPEKKFVYTIPDSTHNYFEFRLEPSLMDVLFDDFRLQLNDNGLTGPHPMDRSKSFQYKKAGH
jgi:hypothetical protein